MSFTSSSHGNTKISEIKPQILHNRMPSDMHLAGCTQPSIVMSDGTPGEPQSQLLGYRGFGYNHIYPYMGGYGGFGGYGGLGAYGGVGYGWGYPYRRCCGYRGGYPWYF
jgi:hypothetical protein